MKAFRAWEVDQVWLLPPSVQELVPADDPAHMVRDLVRQEMDLQAILSTYSEERGYPPYPDDDDGAFHTTSDRAFQRCGGTFPTCPFGRHVQNVPPPVR